MQQHSATVRQKHKTQHVFWNAFYGGKNLQTTNQKNLTSLAGSRSFTRLWMTNDVYEYFTLPSSAGHQINIVFTGNWSFTNSIYQSGARYFCAWQANISLWCGFFLFFFVFLFNCSLKFLQTRTGGALTVCKIGIILLIWKTEHSTKNI